MTNGEAAFNAFHHYWDKPGMLPMVTPFSSISPELREAWEKSAAAAIHNYMCALTVPDL